MPIVAKLDELGKPAWIALMILGFFIWCVVLAKAVAPLRSVPETAGPFE